MCLVKMLMNVGVNVNFEDVMNILFLVVCFGGYIDVVISLLKVGVDINKRIKNNMLLMVVCCW